MGETIAPHSIFQFIHPVGCVGSVFTEGGDEIPFDELFQKFFNFNIEAYAELDKAPIYRFRFHSFPS